MGKPKTIPKEIKDEIKAKTKASKDALPHLSELAEHFVQIVGGPRAMAAMLHTEWVASRAGSLVRSRILDLITRVWKFSTESLGDKQDLGILSEEDIDQLIEEHLAKAAEGISDGELARPEEKSTAKQSQEHICEDATTAESRPNIPYHTGAATTDPATTAAGTAGPIAGGAAAGDDGLRSPQTETAHHREGEAPGGIAESL